LDVEDLTVAKKRLREGGLTLCFVRDGQTLFETSSRGISGFLKAIDELDGWLEGASAADKVVGKAVALLCLHMRIKAVYAPVMSREAKELFERSGVLAEWDLVVDNILDGCEQAPCPFERLAERISDPAEAYKKLKALQGSLGQR